MAISNQIQRLTTLRNNIRTKLINLGILPAASTSATLSECYNVLSSVTGLGASSYTPTTVSQVIPSGRYLSGAQTINAIPSAYIIPSGTVVLSSSGTFDVGSYASADVTVTGGPSHPYVEYRTNGTNAYFSGRTIVPAGFCNFANGISDTLNIAGTILNDGIDFNGTYTFSIATFVGCRFSKTRYSNGLIFGENVGYGTITFGDKCFMRAESFGGAVYISDQRVTSIQFDNSAFDFTTPISFSAPYVSDLSFAGSHSGLNIPRFSFQNVRSIFGGINNNRYIMSVSLPECSFIWGFASCPLLSSFYAPKLTGVIGAGGMQSNGALEVIELPELLSTNNSTVGGVFAHNNNLTRLYLPKYSYLTRGEFDACYKLSDLTMSNSLFSTVLSRFNSAAFRSCRVLPEIPSAVANGTVVISGADKLFYDCRSIARAFFPELVSINAYDIFAYCSKLSVVDMPKLTTFEGTSTFAACSSLLSITFPNWEYTNPTGYAFNSCNALSIVSFPKTSKLSGNYMFSRCYNLISIFLLGSSVCALGNTIASMFYSTPISNYSASAHRWGSVFVPASLLAQYKAATNWTTISSKIFAYEDYFS